jgi:hypothetical protein
VLKRLPIDLADVCIAIETAFDAEMHWFLDAETGATILVSREYDPSDIDGPTRDEIDQAPARYLPIPAADADEATRDMREFIADLEDPRLRESLDIALSGTGPARRFKNVLGHVPEHRDDWLSYKHARTEARARAWLTEKGLEPLPVSPRR